MIYSRYLADPQIIWSTGFFLELQAFPNLHENVKELKQ